MSELRVVMTGLTFGEQPRWHEDRLWFSDWGTQEVIAVDLDGNGEVILRTPAFPCCVDWLPTGACSSSLHAMVCLCAGSPTAHWSPTAT